jgi:hypothetical protein
MKLRLSFSVWLFTCSLLLSMMMPAAVAADLQPTGDFPGTNRLHLAIGSLLRNKEPLANPLREM